MSKWRKRIILALIVLPLCFQTFRSSQAKEQPILPEVRGAKLFPLKKGNYWLYKGRARWTPSGTGQVKEKTLTWKMEVTDVIGREFITAAVLKGHPQDVAWYEDGTKRGDYLILAIGDDLYYFIEGMRVNEVLYRLKDEDDILSDLVFDDELFFRVPVPDNNDPQDLPFAGTVLQQTEAGRVAAALAMDDQAYRVTFDSLPDHTRIDLVPGVGITRFIYQHHGLVSEADMELVEYFAG